MNRYVIQFRSDKIKNDQKYFLGLSIEVTENEYRKAKQDIKIVSKLSKIENTSVSILDLNKNRYLLIGSRFFSQSGFEIEKIKKYGPAYFVSRMKDSERDLIMYTYHRAFEFLNKLPRDEKKKYKFVINYNIKDKNGKYITIILKIAVWETDKKGNIWLIIIMDDILHITNPEKGMEAKLINMETGDSIHLWGDSAKKPKRILSKRECEILNLLATGMLSKEIADRLSISISTVNNHRQSILRKTKTQNTSEAIKYVKQLGIL